MMSGPVFHLRPTGRLANLMIQYMVALKFTDMVPGCQISNVDLPAWNVRHLSLDSAGPVAVEDRQEQHIDLPGLAERMLSGQIKRADWTGFGQRMENFLPRERYQHLFVAPSGTAIGLGPEYLVCPVRAEDILEGAQPDYVLTPVEFYRDLVDMTGLTPVFIGQTEPNAYMDSIRAAFPDAIFRAPQANPLIDFETIRHSRNIAVGVSTYSWLAAWLAWTADNIYMTVNGLFNPLQKPSVDLLPFGDHRFKFYLFPINYAVPLAGHAAVHRRIAPYWRLVSHAALHQMIAAAPRFRFTLQQGLAAFDEAFYLENNADVAELTVRMGPGSARAHYTAHGFQEGRSPVRFDRVWYAAQYPLAGLEVSQGDYLALGDHYLAIGRARGYLPGPPRLES